MLADLVAQLCYMYLKLGFLSLRTVFLKLLSLPHVIMRDNGKSLLMKNELVHYKDMDSLKYGYLVYMHILGCKKVLFKINCTSIIV